MKPSKVFSQYCFCIVGERKKALDGAVQDGQKFQTSLQDMIQWMSDLQDNLEATPPVSGERDTLVKQSLEQEVGVVTMSIFKSVLYLAR